MTKFAAYFNIPSKSPASKQSEGGGLGLTCFSGSSSAYWNSSVAAGMLRVSSEADYEYPLTIYFLRMLFNYTIFSPISEVFIQNGSHAKAEEGYLKSWSDNFILGRRAYGRDNHWRICLLLSWWKLNKLYFMRWRSYVVVLQVNWCSFLQINWWQFFIYSSNESVQLMGHIHNK